MTLLHQAAQKAVEALKLAHHGMIPGLALDKRTAAAIAQLESALQHQEVPREPVADFDTWQQNPYTKVLMDSIKNDYMPRADAEALIRAAASPSTTRQQEVGSGWQLVPEAITEEMHVAAVRTAMRCSGNDDFPRRVWRAMLAAAPSTPEKAGGVREPAFVDWEGRPYDEQGEPLFTEPSPIPHPLPAQANDGGEHG